MSWGFDRIRITNNGSADAVGETINVYLNGAPPFTYKAEFTFPAVGQSAEVPLVTFVKKDGERFSPLQRAVTEAWVGGGGYDYVKFGKR